MKSHYLFTLLYLALLVLAVAAAPTRVNAVRASSVGASTVVASAPAANVTAASVTAGCLSTHDGYLRARLQRASTQDARTDIDWADADMECDGEPRPEHRGIRLTFAGHLPGSGARVRLVFGIAADPKTPSVRNVPANVTVIFEDEQKLYSTAGDGKCTIDELTVHDTRFVARGFCTGPATVVAGSDTLLVERFDFAGFVRDEDAD